MPIWEDDNKVERRIARRVRLTEPVQYESKRLAAFGGCRSVDVSESGVRIQINDFIPLNTELMLEIQLARENVVECIGRVVWIGKLPFGENYEAGLTFVNQETIVETKRTIQQFIELR